MLASGLREEAQATVSNKPGHRGEREVSRKTIARGMPGHARMLILFCMRGCGCIERPAFPAPSDLGAAKRFLHNSGKSRRGNAGSHVNLRPRHCERSEAIHSQGNGDNGLLRRFAPRNDGLRIGCLKIESISSSRTSERSERDPGPITTDVCVAQDWSYNPIDNSDRWLWVPRSRAQLRTRRGRHRDITHLRDPLTRSDDLEMPHTCSRHPVFQRRQ